LLTGDLDDNWLQGAQNCNQANCDQFGRLVMRGVRRYSRNWKGADNNDDPQIAKKKEEGKDDDCNGDSDIARKLRKTDWD